MRDDSLPFLRRTLLSLQENDWILDRSLKTCEITKNIYESNVEAAENEVAQAETQMEGYKQQMEVIKTCIQTSQENKTSTIEGNVNKQLRKQIRAIKIKQAFGRSKIQKFQKKLNIAKEELESISKKVEGLKLDKEQGIENQELMKQQIEMREEALGTD